MIFMLKKLERIFKIVLLIYVSFTIALLISICLTLIHLNKSQEDGKDAT